MSCCEIVDILAQIILCDFIYLFEYCEVCADSVQLYDDLIMHFVADDTRSIL